MKLPESFDPCCPKLVKAIDQVIRMPPPSDIKNVLMIDRSFALGLVELFVTRFSKVFNFVEAWTSDQFVNLIFGVWYFGQGKRTVASSWAVSLGQIEDLWFNRKKCTHCWTTFGRK